MSNSCSAPLGLIVIALLDACAPIPTVDVGEGDLRAGTSAQPAVLGQCDSCLEVAIRVSNGDFITTESDGRLVASATLDTAMRFRLHALGSTRVALQAASGLFVAAENGGGDILVANRAAVGAWETFVRTDVAPGVIALAAENGAYVVAEGSGGGPVLANRTAVGPWEHLTLVELGRGPDLPRAPRVVFIRGGAGTGGFLEGGSDEHLSDIDNHATTVGNHGFGELATLLRGAGFVVEQVIEDPGPGGGAIDFNSLDLANVDVLVFGSNNAVYSESAADVVEAWVRDGGGALFISDANWGKGWRDAPLSDQTFLSRFDLVMNQDNGVYVCDAARFHEPFHSILAGVSAFDGEGVSPISVVDHIADVSPVVLVPAQGDVVNPSTGEHHQATAEDGALVVARVGRGRVAGHFDRNTFFNANGAGTWLSRLDNATYAGNLLRWLARR